MPIPTPDAKGERKLWLTGPAVRSASLVEQRGFELPVPFVFFEGGSQSWSSGLDTGTVLLPQIQGTGAARGSLVEVIARSDPTTNLPGTLIYGIAFQQSLQIRRCFKFLKCVCAGALHYARSYAAALSGQFW
jgi:hypothetical protein